MTLGSLFIHRNDDPPIVFTGEVYGAARSVVGEIVFQTGLVGYTESLTDPSYADQILVLTYPLIGNYGIPDIKELDEYDLPKHMESRKIWLSALIVDRLCPDDEHSHWKAKTSLEQFLRDFNVPCLTGVDTRQITKIIRELGSSMAKLIIVPDNENDFEFKDINEENLVAKVSRKQVEMFGSGELRILFVDCGSKNNQIRCLMQKGATVKVVPWDHPIEDEECDGLFLSSGPGDPIKCSPIVEKIKLFMKKKPGIPIFGICLGHQLLARVAGAETSKLRYGNRGHNQPCTYFNSGRCFITSQNHGYAVENEFFKDAENNEWSCLFVNENDGTNEGMVHKSLPYFSVQFHPEHCAGPMDMENLFDIFIECIKNHKSDIGIPLTNILENILKPFGSYKIPEQNKVLVLGSGGLSIGQAGEFDYSGTQALKALKECSIKSVLVNPNVATVQTSNGFADRTYFLPITKDYVADVIKKERPSGILCTFGGQTALNCAIDLCKGGILKQYNVSVLGTQIDVIMKTEDRELFNNEMQKINEKIAPSQAATSVVSAVVAANQLGYPVLVRSAYALGGLGSGFASNENEVRDIVEKALSVSEQVLIDKSLRGWKEIEYEVMRDAYDNCITVCNMENVDPLGIHTGDSIVVAPSQTLSNNEYQQLRTTAIKVVRHLGIVGECNIQFAVNPKVFEYIIIEVNARLSRSSALASKATGYPLAYVATKLALGGNLSEIRNSATGVTTACFEPSLDYCVVKIPRWDLSKFARVSNRIGSCMKSVGEVMGIGRCFEEAFQKALRMVNEGADGFSPDVFPSIPTDKDFMYPTDKRIFAIARGLFSGVYQVDRIHELTAIDLWFLYRMRNIIQIHQELRENMNVKITKCLLKKAKQCGFSDRQIAQNIDSEELKVRKLRKEFDLEPVVKQIDTVAAEWPATTNYLYLTYNGMANDLNFKSKKSVIVLGSGVYRIGSSVEFDACCVGCIKELTELGYKPIAVNCNPETVSTDYDMCDRLYFEEISFEVIMDICEKERPIGVILAFGGQTPNNIAMSLLRASSDVNINIFGTSPRDIDCAENRFKFSRLLDSLKISQPEWKETEDLETAESFCNEVGYPCLIRPSYVLSGAAMNVAHNQGDLRTFLRHAAIISKGHPVVLSKFIREAKEIDVDAVAFDGKVLAMAISEHVENAGTHSGDATLVTPPQDMNQITLNKIENIVHKIAKSLNIIGPFNIQLIAKNNELRVIECNLRASRSFPFVSKALDYDFIALATRCMLAVDNAHISLPSESLDLLSNRKRIGVKVAQFSFSRLAGADVMLGVEMSSTGEVACFGESRPEAYLKALLSTGFIVPRKTVFLSIGGYHAKAEMLQSIRTLSSLGYSLLASKGTADYFLTNKIKIKSIDWSAGEISEYNEKTAAETNCFTELVKNKEMDLFINLPIRGSGAYRVSAYLTNGYKARRLALDHGIPVVTDIKCAKLLIEALKLVGTRPAMNSQIDSISSDFVIRLPGFIDVHTHMREPGGDHKETWTTGTMAAVAGGITMILAMPNTQPPVIDNDSLKVVEEVARTSLVDYGIYAGGTPTNSEEIVSLVPRIAALKLYLNETFTTLRMDNISDWIKHFQKLPKNRIIVCHAEGRMLAAVLSVAQLTGRAVHIAHVSTAEEIWLIREAKRAGWLVTCEVAPHHLFLSKTNFPNLSDGFDEVRPCLATKEDVEELWKNIDHIDCFASDHAPHTESEKSNLKVPGFPSIEYMVPLFLNAVNAGKLTLQQLVDRLYYNPMRIFQLPAQSNTYIEVDMKEKWKIPHLGGFSKANWTPYSGMILQGRIRTVVIRGEEVCVDGKILVKPGFGVNIRNEKNIDFVVNQTEKSEFIIKDKNDYSDFGSKLIPSKVEPINKSFLTLSNSEENCFKNRSIISVEEFSRSMVRQVFTLASQYRMDIERKNSTKDVLKDYMMAVMFYEPSTRTACSFSSAMQRLGGMVTYMNNETSSVQKGESLEDSIMVMSGYSDVIVLRHPEPGAALRAARVSPKPVINAGDGTGQHPTQALLDLFTIREELGTINNTTIAMVGDLLHGRTVHSLAKLLCVFRGITLHYVIPNEELSMPSDIVDYVSSHGFKQKVFFDLAEGIKGVDVVYMTRIQKERFNSLDEYSRVKGNFILTQKLLNQVSHSQKLTTKGRERQLPIVMHPLPRVDEISAELDSDVRSVYFTQARNGIFVRMALLTLVLDHHCP